ncbi:MAG: ceramide glucosyltransferase, partial [Bryobacteraceae bacterium]|nr:ceramide glucosyltransferase [Bryobacteraceae bacterium]
MTLLIWALAVIAAGSVVYAVLVVAAVRSYRAVPVPQLRETPPVSVLKPLSGADDGLEENLRSFFEQDYPEFEILFAVRTRDDPAVALVERLRSECPGVASRMIVTGEP